MLFDAYAGLSDEYREYALIEPEQLNFRQAANDSERRTAAALIKAISKDAMTLFIIGGVLGVIGILALFQSLGGLFLIVFGLMIAGFGFLKNSQSKTADLVATGTLLKKEMRSTGSRRNNTKDTHRWFVIAVDGMDRTLCVIHASPENYKEATEGDRILVVNDKTIYYGKKMA